MGLAARPVPRRLPRWVVVLGSIAVAFIALYVFGQSFLQVFRLEREEARLQVIKRNLQEQNAILREEMKLLQTNNYVERIAREQLGLLRPDEVAILIVPPPTQPPPAPPVLMKDDASWLARLWRVLLRHLTE